VRLARSAMPIMLLAVATLLYGQGQADVVHAKPIRVRHLSGTVVDPKGFSVEYAFIELLNSADHRVLATTYADAQGKFSFADRKRGEQLEVRASRAGFRRVEYNVSIAIVGKEHVRLVLPVAA
jgi:hypothetical protein